METSQLPEAPKDHELTSTKRIVEAVLALSQGDPWGAGGTYVLNAIEQDIAAYRLNEADAHAEAWRSSECRAQVHCAEEMLRSEEFREESGLRPWGLLVGTAGALALTDDEGRSPLHWAAENNAWYAVPESALTADAMLQRDAKNETPFGMAAKRHALHNISEEALTRLASSRNRAGETPLHLAACGGYLLTLPRFMKTEELLAQEDAEGRTVLECHHAATHAHD
jgi:hypothetical protein